MIFLSNLGTAVALTAVLVYSTLVVKILVEDSNGWLFVASCGLLVATIVFFLYVWEGRKHELRKASLPKDPADSPTQKIR
jgi:hypothetical protein